MNELVGVEATVTSPIRGADGPGEVEVPYRGVFIAYSDEQIARGKSVVIYEEMGARKVRVTPLREVN
jgi:membrane protein implicated in regulation of membrane protease activity